MEMDKYTRKSLEVVEKAKKKALEYDNPGTYADAPFGWLA